MPGFFGGPVFLDVTPETPASLQQGGKMITLGFRRTESGSPRPRRLLPQISRFLRICEQVADFIEEHDGQDFEVFFARDGNSINLYLMTRSEAYNFDLSRHLAEFAAPYIERGLLDSATLLPASANEELAAFFDPKRALRIEIQHG
jgi:hypothetical protein